MHWINASTAIVAVGSDIQLIDVSNGSCHVRGTDGRRNLASVALHSTMFTCFGIVAPIKRIHSDSIRELAVSSTTHILSGGTVDSFAQPSFWSLGSEC